MKRHLDKHAEHQKYFLRDGTGPLPGASTVAKVSEDSGGLIHWAFSQGKLGKDYREERDAAADSGTIAHALAEAHLVGDELDLSDFTQEAIDLGRIAFKNFLEWWEEKEMTFIATELQLVSHDHLFGGTLDILARNPEGKICLIDLKATKSIRAAHGVQCGGYSLLVNENSPEEPVDEICILRLPKDGKPVEPLWLDALNFPFYQKCFLANLAAYNARQQLEALLPAKLKKWKPWPKKKKLAPLPPAEEEHSSNERQPQLL